MLRTFRIVLLDDSFEFLINLDVVSSMASRISVRRILIEPWEVAGWPLKLTIVLWDPFQLCPVSFLSEMPFEPLCLFHYNNLYVRAEELSTTEELYTRLNLRSTHLTVRTFDTTVHTGKIVLTWHV